MHHVAGDRAGPLTTGVWQQELLTWGCKEECQFSVVLTRTEIDCGTITGPITGPGLPFLTHQFRCLLQRGKIVKALLSKREKDLKLLQTPAKTRRNREVAHSGVSNPKTGPDFDVRA